MDYISSPTDRRLIQQLLDSKPGSLTGTSQKIRGAPSALSIPVHLPEGGLRGEVWGIKEHVIPKPSDESEYGSLNDTELALILAQVLRDFRDYPLFRLEAIDPEVHQNRFVILSEDIPKEETYDGEKRGGYGRAVDVGLVYVKIKVSVESHKYARLSSTKEHLDSDPDGPITIIWREDLEVPDPEDEEADVIAHAFVLLGSSSSTSCPDLKEFYVDGNPAEGEFLLQCEFNEELGLVTIPYDSTADAAQQAFEEHPEVNTVENPTNLTVSGGPLPWKSLNVVFQGNLRRNAEVTSIANNVTPLATLKIRAINLDQISAAEEEGL